MRKRSARRRIRDHRGELAFGCDFAVEHRLAGKLAHATAFLDELDLELEQHTGLDGFAELHAVDRHEIDQLARSGEPEALDRAHARCLSQRLDLEHAGHDRPSREMSLEKFLVHADRFDRGDRPVGDQRLDPGDQQHRVTMRQRRQDPLDAKRAQVGRYRRFVAHRPRRGGVGAGAGVVGAGATAPGAAAGGCGSGVTLIDGSCALICARTSLVTSIESALASVELRAITISAPRCLRIASVIGPNLSEIWRLMFAWIDCRRCCVLASSVLAVFSCCWNAVIRASSAASGALPLSALIEVWSGAPAVCNCVRSVCARVCACCTIAWNWPPATLQALHSEPMRSMSTTSTDGAVCASATAGVMMAAAAIAAPISLLVIRIGFLR